MRALGIIFALLLLATTPTLAATLSGKVVRVADGDTITILTPNKEEVKIRLVEIDAPEKDQPYGQKSKQSLSDLVFEKDVRVEWEKTDKYKRTLGRVFVGDTDVNLQQVKNGAAWAYLQYLTDERIKQAESEARAAKAGLWALQADQIIPPWEWRHGRKSITRQQ
jgi:micrococcal nuclease